MSRSNRLVAAGVSLVCVAAGVVLMVAANSAAQPPRSAQWKKVDEAMNKGLPKTAIKELEPIIASAMREKAYPEAIKAIAKKIALEGNIEGNKPEEKVTRMQAAIATAPAEMHPVMNAVLAHWYWHYFQQNRWRFTQRTATGEAPGTDLTTWDLPRIFAEIDKQFEKALANEKELKATPIGQYDALLEKGTIPDKFRPTLFDFLAFDALSFYASGEQAGARPDDAFDPPADGPIFDSADAFLKWNPQTTDQNSRTLKGVKLLQKVLDFHKGDADKAAFLDANLHRLRFGFNKAVGPEKNARYVAALTAFATDHEAHELSAMARYHWAGVIRTEGDLVRAREIALVGVRTFPDSPGGKLCFNLVQDIEAKSSGVTTERVWGTPAADIRVTYRNLTKVYFRVVKADYEARLRTQNRWRPEHFMNREEQLALMRQKPELEFEKDLPPTPDYQTRTEIIPAPAGLKPGFYFLFASHAANFGEQNNTVSVTDFWVSELAVVGRQDNGRLRIEGMVVNNATGEPVAGAKVQVWHRENKDGWRPADAGVTDAAGLYSVPGKHGVSHLAIVTHKDQQLSTGQEFYTWDQGRDNGIHIRTVFFTDRSIYRPGQTIQFKGITLQLEQGKDAYEVLPNRAVTVLFADVNGKEVARLQTRTNDYGSFSGSFTAPRDRLTGQMTIRTEDHSGATNVSVEEYKRPKFQVTVEASKDAAKLNDTVKVPGKAMGYNGVPIGGAKVAFRVTREVRFPPWFFEFCWWRPVPSGPAQEIAHGTVTSEADGTFTVAFVARPDPTVTEKDEASFRYTVTADVTDTTGETRSGAKSVEVGFVALRATIGANPWQTDDKDVKFDLTTTTLDGEGQAAKGTFKVYPLTQPETVARPDIQGNRPRPMVRRNGKDEPATDPANPASWDVGAAVFTGEFATNGNGKADLNARLPAGIYRAVLETTDKFGKAVTAKAIVRVLNPAATHLTIKLPSIVEAPKWSLEPGEEFTLFWGTGYEKGRAYVEVEHRGQITKAAWSDPAKTQHVLKVPITEAMRGGFTVRVTFVRDNRAHLVSRHVDVPWTNKAFTVKWERFVSKLEPGKKETFTAVVTGPDAKKAVAEMVAAMYDASLDAFRPHNWMSGFNVFRHDYSHRQLMFENLGKHLNHVYGSWSHNHKPVDLTYRGFPGDVTLNLQRYEYFGRGGGEGLGYSPNWGMMVGPGGMPPPGAVMGGAGGLPGEGFTGGGGKGAPGMDAFTGRGVADGALARFTENAAGGFPLTTPGEPGQTGPDLNAVAARKNLNETAFFFPHLVSDNDGVVRMEFTMPEALTKWKFLGFAHDRSLRGGLLTDEVVTSKDLMAQPNPPRFLREGDVIEFTVKVSNQSPTRQQGKVRLTLSDTRSQQPLDAALGNATPDQDFDLPAGESKSFAWRLTIPDGVGPITYKAVAATERLSDGEEAAIPVLSRRVLVTESMPLPIRNAGTKQFDFVKLRESGNSNTIKSQSYTVQMCSQPAWYAVMALPYLMEFPHECSEQTFNRLYANALARHLANSNPKIRRVFDEWKNTPALDSPLEKNQDLKGVLLDETPWVQDAAKESQARRNVGILFDDNRLNQETARVSQKLADMQFPDGAWPWFPGGPGNDYITLYITTGYGRLRHLGVRTLDTAPAVKALGRLDAWVDKMYRDALRGKPDENHLSSTIALYLYARSFFLADKPVANEHRAAIDYWLGQSRKFWLQLANRQSQAHLALALKRFGDKDTPRGIMASIKERSVSNEEMGMFWRDTELSFYWYRAPIETQAMMVEAFDEVMNDAAAVEDCKVWLLKQKQTRDWKTTKATADAVYALLLRGENLLKSDALVEVTVGNIPIKPEKTEAGTGFYEEKFVRNEVNPSMAAVTVKKTDAGVSWGSVHWSYLEDITKVTPHDGTPLKLEKKLFNRTFTKAGPVINPFKNDPLSVGDEVVVRLVLRTDRDMEYVHLKDHRGSGTEPVNVLSRYKYQDGLGYYESTKDTATHFFIDYLPKGTYVFEYPVRVQLKGKYPTGFANIQCMYAPEFNSHSENITLEVK